MSPPHAAKPAAAAAANGPRKIDRAGHRIETNNKRSHRSAQVAVISKSSSAQVRISLTSWRGAHKLDIREATASIPGVFFPTPNGVTLDLDKIARLIGALQKAQAEARERGLLHDGEQP